MKIKILPVPDRIGKLFGRAFLRDRRQLENLAQIGQISGIVAHGLFRRIRHLGDRLAVATDHFHDDLQGLMPQIVGQVGADAE